MSTMRPSAMSSNTGYRRPVKWINTSIPHKQGFLGRDTTALSSLQHQTDEPKTANRQLQQKLLSITRSWGTLTRALLSLWCHFGNTSKSHSGELAWTAPVRLQCDSFLPCLQSTRKGSAIQLQLAQETKVEMACGWEYS